MKNTRLYLSNWDYNASLILTELENIVLENGGAIVSDWKTERTENYTITNRTLDKAIRDQIEHVKKIEMFNPTFSGLQAEKEKLEKMQAINNEPITNNFGNHYYISFAIGDTHYMYDLDDNPFFDFYYSKEKIINGCITKNCYRDKESKEWLYDCFFRYDCTPEMRKEVAHLIFNKLLKARYSTKYRSNLKPKKLNVLEGTKTW